MFERTKSGQQNRALFFRTNYTCYVEGGGDDGEHSYDVTFWTAVFRTFLPALTIRCVPRGGKPILEKLANNIIEQGISNTLVAIDSDYDFATNQTINDPRVLYTFGYSWENDVFNIENLKLAFLAIAHTADISPDAEQFLEDSTKKFENEMRWPVRGDFLALSAGSSLLPRKSPGRIVKYVESEGPSVSRTEVLKLAKILKNLPRPRSYESGNVDRIARYCVGHIHELGMIYTIRGALSRFMNRRNLSPEHARDVALQTFLELLRTTPQDEIAQHHQAQCARI